MKRWRLAAGAPLALLVALLLAAAWFVALQRAAAKDWEAPALPVSPEVLAQGGSFTANAQGFQALFYNPAAFSSPQRSLTLLSASSWVYADPGRLFESLPRWEDPVVLEHFLEQEITTGGFGIGSAAGIGYVGRGVGLGLALATDSYLWGPTALGAAGRMTVDLQFVAGFALKTIGDRLSLGADVRPLVRLVAPVDYAAMFGFLDGLGGGGDPLAALEASPALYGFGFGIDLGAILELSGWKIGLSVRDFLGTRLGYTQSTVGEVLDSLQQTGGFPAGGADVAEEHLIPMDLSLGLAYRFDFAPRVVDPVVHLSLSDLLAVARGERSPWAMLHVGTELRLLSVLALRAGLNQGYLTFGGGLRLPLLDLNAAFFSREMGRHLGDQPSSGMALEAALRLPVRARPRQPSN